jgi:hypothetical protein
MYMIHLVNPENPDNPVLSLLLLPRLSLSYSECSKTAFSDFSFYWSTFP